MAGEQGCRPLAIAPEQGLEDPDMFVEGRLYPFIGIEGFDLGDPPKLKAKWL